MTSSSIDLSLYPLFEVSRRPNDYVRPQVPVRSERFAALHFVSNSQPIQRTGDRGERRSVLIYLRSCSANDA